MISTILVSYQKKAPEMCYVARQQIVDPLENFEVKDDSSSLCQAIKRRDLYIRTQRMGLNHLANST